MIQIIFFYVVVEIPGDIVKGIHRMVSGDNFREANKWVYRFAGALLFIVVVSVILGLSEVA